MAISLDRAQSQWIDLGILSNACITDATHCGTAGGAVAFWMRSTESGLTCPVGSMFEDKVTGITTGLVIFISTKIQ